MTAKISSAKNGSIQVDTHYDHLIACPETGYKQLYLKGIKMRVGQLIYKMRANRLTAEEAAQDMALPLVQIHEAQAYYQAHKALRPIHKNKYSKRSM